MPKKTTQSGKKRAASKIDTKCEISLVGGAYDSKKLGVVYPTPKYIVLSMGKELYLRQDPDNVLDATYRYTDDWASYREWLKEQALFI